MLYKCIGFCVKLSLYPREIKSPGLFGLMVVLHLTLYSKQQLANCLQQWLSYFVFLLSRYISSSCFAPLPAISFVIKTEQTKTHRHS